MPFILNRCVAGPHLGNAEPLLRRASLVRAWRRGPEVRFMAIGGRSFSCRLSVRQLLKSKGLGGSYPGIQLSAASHASSLSTLHVVFGENAGFSAILKMFDRDSRAKLLEPDYASTGTWTLRASMLALSTPDPALASPPRRRLASYFGIAPRMRNSNETERSRRITRGSKLRRTALVRCAFIAKRYGHLPGELRAHPQPTRNGPRHHRPGPQIPRRHLKGLKPPCFDILSGNPPGGGLSNQLLPGLPNRGGIQLRHRSLSSRITGQSSTRNFEL